MAYVGTKDSLAGKLLSTYGMMTNNPLIKATGSYLSTKKIPQIFLRALWILLLIDQLKHQKKWLH